MREVYFQRLAGSVVLFFYALENSIQERAQGTLSIAPKLCNFDGTFLGHHDAKPGPSRRQVAVGRGQDSPVS